MGKAVKIGAGFGCLLALLCLSCAGRPDQIPAAAKVSGPGSAGRSFNSGAADTPTTAALPPIQAVLDVLAARAGSFTDQQGYRWGSDFEEALAAQAVTRQGYLASFGPEDWQPGLLDLSYAAYSFELSSYDGSPASLQLFWTVKPQPGTAFLALPDLQQHRWRWLPLESDLLDLGALGNSLSPQKQLALLVVCSGSQPSQLAWLQLAANNEPRAMLSVVTGDPLGSLPSRLQLYAGASKPGADPGSAISAYDWDFDGDGTYDLLGQSSAAEHIYESAGTYYPTLRVTDEDGLQAYASTSFVVSRPPQASISVDIPSPATTEPVSFDAAASSDPDGDTLSFEWSYNGQSWQPGDITGLLTGVSFVQPGTRSFFVRVTDPSGLESTASVQLDVHESPLAQLAISEPWLRGEDKLLDAAGSSA